MRKQPLEETLVPNSGSPRLAHFHEDSSHLWRASSFTEGIMSGSTADDENHTTADSTVTALHASFDAALLDHHTSDKDSIFRTVKKSKGLKNYKTSTSFDADIDTEASTDTTAAAAAPLGELTGRKHLRVAPLEPSDVVAPSTLRKHPRTRTATAAATTRQGTEPRSRTPARGRMRPPGSTKKKLTPTSAARRRSARGSTATKLPSPTPSNMSNIGIPPTPPRTRPAESRMMALNHPSPLTPRKVSLGGGGPPSSRLKPPQMLTPTPGPPRTVLKQKPHAASYTGTTVNSSLETSHETASPATTPFKFCSFPASLPRVHNPRTTRTPSGGLESVPGIPIHSSSTRKADHDESAAAAAPNQSREEEGTHNSSLSSWSGDGGPLLPSTTTTNAVPSFPPPVLEWKSPHEVGRLVLGRKENTDLLQSEPRHAASSRVFSQDKEGYGYRDDDDDEDSFQSPLGGSQVTRTRLNFNLVLGSGAEGDDDKKGPTNETKNHALRRFSNSSSGHEEGTAASTTSVLSPTESGKGALPLFPRHDRPQSPMEVQVPFRMDAQCSPIPGIGDDGAPYHGPSSLVCDMDIEADATKAPPSVRQRKSRPPLIPCSSPKKRSQRNIGSSNNTSIADTENDESSRLSLSLDFEDSASSTTSSKMRRLRPMPDISGFDAGLSLQNTSGEKTADESLGTSETRHHPPSPKLVCPPTPVRTPAWAQGEGGHHTMFARSNSLIATKVLATCPIQVLDGHSSLENSLLEDDDDSEPDAFAPRFSTLVEEFEGMDESAGMKDLSELHEMLTATDAAVPTKLKRHVSAPVAIGNVPPPPTLVATTSCSGRVLSSKSSSEESSPPPPKPLARRLTSGFGEVGSVISFSNDFDNLGKLGSGTFADVFKVRSRADQQLYAVKRNRRQFRGKRDREMALAEVRTMQRLQSVCAQQPASDTTSKAKTKNSFSLYVLFFCQAWQEEGYFFCQTELCCRDTCRELMQSLRSNWPSASKKYPSLARRLNATISEGSEVTDETIGRLLPESSVWKICHDVAAGLSHIHSHGIVHNDIKASNIFLVSHGRFGAMCKIGDFGMAGDAGSSEDGQEGDTLYMAPELLSSSAKHPSADLFSLGLSLYELASSVAWELPSEGPRWLELRNGTHVPELPKSRSKELSQLIQSMIHPVPEFRPTADDILDKVERVKETGSACDEFLKDYIKDIEDFDRAEEHRLALEKWEAHERGQTPRHSSNGKRVFQEDSMTPTTQIPLAPVLFTPEAN